jgi:hypothetical protein
MQLVILRLKGDGHLYADFGGEYYKLHIKSNVDKHVTKLESREIDDVDVHKTREKL